MLTFVDGYNLLFALDFQASTLQQAREGVLAYIQDLFKGKKGVWVVFDGKQEQGLGYSRIKRGSLEVIYTIDGMSADAYILEWLQSHPKERVTVYTNDRGLQRQLTEYQATSVSLDKLKQERPSMANETDTKGSLADPRYEKYLLETFTKKLL